MGGLQDVIPPLECVPPHCNHTFQVEIPNVDDHVSKLEHMGKETVKKLQVCVEWGLWLGSGRPGRQVVGQDRWLCWVICSRGGVCFFGEKGGGGCCSPGALCPVSAGDSTGWHQARLSVGGGAASAARQVLCAPPPPGRQHCAHAATHAETVGTVEANACTAASGQVLLLRWEKHPPTGPCLPASSRDELKSAAWEFALVP